MSPALSLTTWRGLLLLYLAGLALLVFVVWRAFDPWRFRDFVYQGRVVDAASGAAVAGAVVRLDLEHPRSRTMSPSLDVVSHVDTTDVDGRFEIRARPSSAWMRAIISGPGHAPRCFWLPLESAGEIPVARIDAAAQHVRSHAFPLDVTDPRIGLHFRLKDLRAVSPGEADVSVDWDHSDSTRVLVVAHPGAGVRRVFSGGNGFTSAFELHCTAAKDGYVAAETLRVEDGAVLLDLRSRGGAAYGRMVVEPAAIPEFRRQRLPWLVPVWVNTGGSRTVCSPWSGLVRAGPGVWAPLSELGPPPGGFD